MESTIRNQNVKYPEFLSGGGEMGDRIRNHDWSKTSLGPVKSWPQSLRSALSICLNSNFPIAIYWGKELVLLYNDSWSLIPGNKHPWALGRPAKEVWPDIWDAIEPQFKKAFAGEPGGSKDALLPMQRHGYTEECYFDFTFTPVYGEGGKVEGIFNAVIETTYRVINERRSAFLKNLALSIASAQSAPEVFEQTTRFLRTAAEDVSFALAYSFQNNQPHLAASTGKDGEAALLKKPLPFSEAIETEASVHLKNLADYFIAVPQGHWPEAPEEGLLVPMKAGSGTVIGFLFCGLSARRRMDAEYKIFIESIATAVATILNNISSLQEERKRAEALAEIDRAKTLFFSNISHEFRTPLTLMLGPLEDALNDPNTLQDNKIRMDVARRNGLRLQKLVNTLLDFSRIEAGRMQANFETIDVCILTADLASSFRSAVEKEGMQLIVNCEANLPFADVDLDMWEKIVLNLISNAFKYTTAGKIEVVVKRSGEWLQLSVSDTGIGIPQDQLIKIFDRFHRVSTGGGRSQEGTGIGLSLVQELVNIHNGSIDVESEVGMGSVFTVLVPFHQPAKEGMAEAAAKTKPLSKKQDAFVEEASRWTPASINADYKEESNVAKPTVLVADDNSDMRDYISRLLAGDYRVLTATNGADAFTIALRDLPQLIISDVMMPQVDGFGLLKNLRENDSTANIPFIFLSARAGEEAKVEGLQAGADDYLVKPFSAKELLVRVWSHIHLEQARNKALQNIYGLFDEVPFAVAVLKGEDLVIDFVNRYNLNIWQKKKEEVLGKPLFEARPDIRAGAEQVHREVYRTGKRFVASEIPLDLSGGEENGTRYFNAIIDPMFDESGRIIGQLASSIEVTEQVLARKRLEQSEAALRELADAMPQLVWIANEDGNVSYYNDRVNEFAGATRTSDGAWHWEGLVHPDDLQRTNDTWAHAIRTGTVYQTEHRIQMKDGSFRWFLSRGLPQADETGSVRKWFGTATDIHDVKTADEKIRENEKRFRSLAQNIPDIITRHGKDFRYLYVSPAIEAFTGIKAEDYIGKTCREVGLPEEVCVFLEQQLAHIFITKKQHAVEYEKLDEPGTYVYSRMVPEFDKDGEITSVLIVTSDITERKKTENKLQHSATLMQSVADAVIGTDMNYCITSWNRGAELTYGWRSEEVIGKPARDIVKTEFLSDNASAEWQKALKESGYWQGEVVQRRKDGSRVPILASVAYVKNERGEYAGAVGVNRDITVQKKAHQELVAVKNQLELTFRNVPSAIYHFDKAGRILYLNEKGATQMGYTSVEEVLAETDIFKMRRTLDAIFEVLDETGRPLPVEKSSAALTFQTGKPSEVTAKFIHRQTGDSFWLLSKSSPLFDDEGALSIVLTTSTDITVQKEAEAKIRQSEETFRNFGNNITNLAWMTDGEGWIYWYNQRWYDYTGTTVEEMQGWGWQKVHHPDHVQRVVEFVKEAWLKPEPFELTFPLRRWDGEYRWFLTRAVPVLNEEGKVYRWIGTNTDIHEQKLAEAALQESESRFRSMANDTPAFMFMADADTHVEFVNRQWVQFVGLSSEEASGKAWATVTHPDDVQPMMAIYSKAVETRQPYTFEIRQKRYDGQYRWILWKGIPRVDSNGGFAGMMGVGLDITDSKKASEALKESEDRFRTTFENAAVGIAHVGLNGKWLFINNRIPEILGYSRDEMKGMSFQDITYADDLHTDLNYIEQLLKGVISTYSMEKRYVRKDGSLVWVNLTASLMTDEAGKPRHFVSIVEDISLRKKAEDVIKENEERLRVLAETLPNMVWATDAAGNYDYASGKWLEYSGLDPHNEATWAQMVHPDDMQGMTQTWTHCLQTGVPYHTEVRLKNKAGEYRWHVVDGEAVRNRAGEIVKWIGAFTDIHDQKTLTQNLEKLVAERTKELYRSNEDLQQFAHVASHDLKEPVRKVRTFGSRLEEEFGDLLPERGKLYLDKMQSAADRMFGLIDGVLNYSTVNSLEGSMEKVDLNLLFSNIETDLEVVLQQKGGKVEKATLPAVTGSPVLLNQLFYNLINNALKFAKADVPPLITIRAKEATAAERKEAGLPDGGKYLQISVCDNGIGFNQEYAGKIFKTFTRLNSRDKYEGTGLGLALCKKIAERHHGGIYATGAPGEGACFYVLLPL